MESNHKRHNASWLSDRDSPKRPLTPKETASTKKGFISSLFTKKKPAGAAGDAAVEMQSTANNGATGDRFFSKPKQKFLNRKNISDGRIKLNVVDSDRVPEDYVIDYKDNPFDVLDNNPIRTTSYIENLKSREYNMVNNREVKRFVESQQQKSQTPVLHANNLEVELYELDKSFQSFFGKFFRFFQGLLAGFCIIHLLLIFGGVDSEAMLNSYVLSALRVNQLFQVVALLCTVGAWKGYIETRDQYHDAMVNQPMIKDALRSQYIKYGIAAISFTIVYGIIIFNHTFVAQTSDVADNITYDDFSTSFSIFRVLSVIMAIFSIIGWFTLILAFQEISKYQVDPINYADLTGYEDIDEQQQI